MQRMSGTALARRVALQRRDDAALALAAAQRAEQSAVAQLEQLQAYFDEKSAGWMARAQVQGAPEILLHHRSFLAKLDSAMAYQQQVIAERAQGSAHARAQLLHLEQRLMTLDALLRVQQTAQQRRQAQLEQRASDELAQVQFLHRQRSASNTAIGEHP
jgi:flagellar FliJ protein